MSELVKLKDVCQLKKGKKVQILNNKTPKSIPYLLIDTLRGIESKVFTEDDKYTDAIEDDVLIVCDGANSGLVGTGLRGAVGSTIARLRIDLTEVNKDYFMYFLKLNFSDLNTDIKGAAIPHLKQDKLLNLNLFKPTLKEQDLIVAEIEKQFTKLDAIVEDLKNIKTKLAVYRKVVLIKSFYGTEKTLPQIVNSDKHSIKRGPFGGSLKKEIFVPHGYKIYEQQHAINNDFEIGKYFINAEKYKEMEAFKVKPGDFIISCSGTIGRIAEVPKNAMPGIINQALLKITLDNKKILNDYFKYLFQSEIIQRYIMSRGVAIKNVPSVKELKRIVFPVPNINEQQNILENIESKFSVIDKLEETTNQALVKVELLRKSILKKAFSGELIK